MRLQKCAAPDNLVVLTVLLALALQAARPAAAPRVQEKIPLVKGLTIVTAIAERRGDYESIKTVTEITNEQVSVAYVAEMSNGTRIEALRHVLRKDLLAAREYRQEFMNGESRAIPGTTALGPSAAVIDDLNRTGGAVFSAYTRTSGGLRKVTATIAKVGIVRFPVLLNGSRVELDAIHARGDYARETGEFWFLSDTANPITLRYRFVEKKSPEIEKIERMAGRGLNVPLREYALDVVRITFQGSQPASAGLEKQLAAEGRAEIYGIYFDFDKATLKPESAPVLAEIAAVMKRQPAWRLNIEGHTDNVGTDAHNSALSRQRADAVKQALVREHGIEAGRLVPAGFGASRPRESNDTIAGRARNRRVELVKR